MSNSTNGQKHTCVLCDSKLNSKEELQEHFRKHANKEIDSKGHPMKAKVPINKSQKQTSPSKQGCPKSSGQTSKASEIVCDVCGQEFETVSVAIRHKFRKHPESAAKHFCPHCGMQFPLKINRDKHMESHDPFTPTKLFPCNDCGVVFYKEEAQSYHIRSTHKRIVAIFQPVATPPPSKKIKVNNAGEAQSVYYCHLCGFEYIVKFNLQKHLERQHSEEERNKVPEDLIKCTACDALFYNKRAYDNHNMYHKPGDLYVTSEEQRLQTVSRVDQDFDIRRVQTAAEKFIRTYRRRTPNNSMKRMTDDEKSQSELSANSKGLGFRNKKIKAEDTTEELSPNSSDSESDPLEDITDKKVPFDSDSESDIPLVHRLNAIKS